MSSILFRPQCFSPLPLAIMSLLCGVRAIYILTMCISGSIFEFHWPPMLEIGRWTWIILGLFGPHVLWDSWPVTLNADQASVPLKVFRSVSGYDRGLGVLGRSWGGFAHVATVTLSWRVRNFVVIGGMRFEWGTTDFGRVLGSVGLPLVGRAPELWNLHMFVNPHDQNIFSFFCFCFESLLFASCIISCHVGSKLY